MPDIRKKSGLSLVDFHSPGKFPKVSAHLSFSGREDPRDALLKIQALENQVYPSMEILVFAPQPLKPKLKAYTKKKQKIKIKEGEGKEVVDLNKALDLCSSKSEYVLLCSSEAILPPHGIYKAMEEIHERQLDYLGLPSMDKYSIAGASAKEEALTRQSIVFSPFLKRTTLLSDDCALIKKSALEQTGGWSPAGKANLAAATSLKLLLRGFRGGLSRQVCAQARAGSFLSLRLKKIRRTIESACLALETTPRDYVKLGRKKTCAVLLQLGEGQEFLFLPFLWFLLEALEALTGANLIPETAGAAALSGATILLSLYLKLSWLYQKAQKAHGSKEILKIYFCQLGFYLESNLGWVLALAGIKTPRQADSRSDREQGKNFPLGLSLIPHLLLAFATSALSFYLFSRSENIAVVAPLFAGALSLTGAVVIRAEYMSGQGITGRQKSSEDQDEGPSIPNARLLEHAPKCRP